MESKRFTAFFLICAALLVCSVARNTGPKSEEIASQAGKRLGVVQTRAFSHNTAVALGFNEIPVGFLRHEAFEIPILKKKNAGVANYFIPPPMTFVPNSAKTISDPFTATLQISFSIKVADKAIEQKATQLLREATGRSVTVKTIDFFGLRITNKTKLIDQIKPRNAWISNQNYGEIVKFTLLCKSDDICPKLHEKINENPWLIAYNFQVETRGSPGSSPDALATWHIQNGRTSNAENLTVDWNDLCQGLPNKNGWCVFQSKKKTVPSLTKQSWTAYKAGIGNYVDREFFWGGLEKVRQLSISGKHKLRVEWATNTGEQGYVEYTGFYLGPESDRYRFHVGRNVSGTVGDIFFDKCGATSYVRMNPREMPFCTWDKDLANSGTKCIPSTSGYAKSWSTGWWTCGVGSAPTCLNYYTNPVAYCVNGKMVRIYSAFVKMMIQ